MHASLCPAYRGDCDANLIGAMRMASTAGRALLAAVATGLHDVSVDNKEAEHAADRTG